MNIKARTEKGQALILIALAAVGIFAFSALAIDGSRAFSDKRNAQNAADSAVLAAALAKVRGDDYVDVAESVAANNGYENNGTLNLEVPDTSVVMVNLCNETGVDCAGMPASASNAVKAEYIRVRIVSYLPSTFARILGRQTIMSAAEAVSRAQVPTTASSGTFFNGAGMAAIKKSNGGQPCLRMNGNSDLALHNTGIFVNCSGNDVLELNGSAQLYLDANANTVGSIKNQGGILSGAGKLVPNQQQLDIKESTFAAVPTVSPTPTCTKQGSISGNTLSEGYFNGNVSLNNDTTLSPGTYCFNGGLNLNGKSNLQGTGTVKMVLTGNLNLNGSANTFDGLEIYTTSSAISIKGNMTANRLRFFATGSGIVDVDAQGSLTSPNAYIYSRTGEIIWNAQSEITLHAPPQGDTFGGLLIYMPWSNTGEWKLNGGSDVHLTGTILAPMTDITYNGGADFELHGQVIGSTFIVNGGSETDIYYVASENYQLPAPDSPTIQLIN